MLHLPKICRISWGNRWKTFQHCISTTNDNNVQINNVQGHFWRGLFIETVRFSQFSARPNGSLMSEEWLLFRVVYHRYWSLIFEIKILDVKLIGRQSFLAGCRALNQRTCSYFKLRPPANLIGHMSGSASCSSHCSCCSQRSHCFKCSSSSYTSHQPLQLT